MTTMRSFPACIVLFVALSCAEPELVPVLHTLSVEADSFGAILPIRDSLVRPVLYHNLPSFEGLTVDETKEKFIGVVLPAILVARYRLDSVRQKVMELSQRKKWSGADSAFYKAQLKRFQAAHIEGLLSRMRTHPNSIVLAQAVVESGWGSSRFFRQANNLFGIWAYRTSEPRILAGKMRSGQRIFLRKYTDISHSIMDYFETVGRARAYRHFRTARMETDTVEALLPHLRWYSERRDDYVDQLRTIIRQNNFTEYDRYQIDPAYFVLVKSP